MNTLPIVVLVDLICIILHVVIGRPGAVDTSLACSVEVLGSNSYQVQI
jgi:hypothetical protein